MIELISQWWLIVVWALAAHLAYKYFNNKINKRNVDDPQTHSFFFEMTNHITNTTRYIKSYYKNVYCNWRTKLIQKMLSIKLLIWNSNWVKLVPQLIQAKNRREIKELILGSFNSITKDYEEKWRYEWVPDVVIEKFSEWHKVHTDVFIKCLENVIASNGFNSSKEVINSILHLWNALLIQTITDAEASLWSLNWEISWLKIKLDWNIYIME